MKIRHVVGHAQASGLLFQRSARPDKVTNSVDWAQLSRFHLKTETETSFRRAVCLK
jgi:hypothetical protein